MWIKEVLVNGSLVGYEYGYHEVSAIVTTSMLNRGLDKTKYPQGYIGLEYAKYILPLRIRLNTRDNGIAKYDRSHDNANS